MKRKTKIILLAVLVPVIVIPVLLIVLAMLLMASKDSGSPKLAAHWREQISTYATPREAKAAEARIAAHEFENGEWVFGFAQNSHGGLLHGGGTVVVKDSRGEVRSFAGHVCGPSYLQWAIQDAETLDEFYDELTSKLEFLEQR